MPVRRPRHPDVNAPVGDLSSSDRVVRDSAVARLVAFGPRAVGPVEALARDVRTSAHARRGALQVLVEVGPRLAVDAAAECALSDDDGLAVYAIDVLSAALTDRGNAATAERALDHLTRLALDQTVPTPRRLAVADTLADLPPTLRQPIFDALARDTVARVAERATGVFGPELHLARWAADDRLPSSADELARALAAEGEDVPVTVPRRLIDQVRARERAASGGHDEWRRVRGLLHLALARRGSTIALYDLRETLEDERSPLAEEFLEAARLIADGSCLDGLAGRWTRTPPGDPTRGAIEAAFHAAVDRSRLRRTSPAVVRLLERLPAAGALLAGVPRRARRSP